MKDAIDLNTKFKRRVIDDADALEFAINDKTYCIEQPTNKNSGYILLYLFNVLMAFYRANIVMTETGLLPSSNTLTPQERSAMVKIYDLRQSTMGQVAKCCNYTPSKTTRFVDTLIKKGLVQRDFDPLNRRIILVSPTQKGVDLVEADNAYVQNHFLNLIKDISETERAELLDHYLAIISIYKKYCNLAVVPDEFKETYKI